MSKPYEIVGLGGTFDHFHAGHRLFLQFAGRYGKHLHVGITHPKLTQGKSFAETIEPFAVRKLSVETFCRQQKISAATSQLTDIYGPTLEKSKIEALIVTAETLPGARAINDLRHKLGLSELPIQMCPFFLDENNQPLHADSIRAGKVSREGIVYANIFAQDFIFNQTQREYFSHEQGQKVEAPHSGNQHLVCVVGDSSLERFIKNNWSYHLGIFDRKRQRQVIDSPIIDQLTSHNTVENPAGQITVQLIKALRSYLQQPTSPFHLTVNGEEDLATVALMLLLPLGSFIYYGQPGNGLIEVLVTEKLKNQVYQVLKD